MSETINKKSELVELGKKLKELRSDKGKSQKEAAGDIKIKPSTLSSYEIGDKEPPIIILNKIAKHYNVTVDYLTGNSDSKTPQHEAYKDLLSKDAISKILMLSDRNRLFLDVFLSWDSFYYLLDWLFKYIDHPTSVFAEIENKTTGKESVHYQNLEPSEDLRLRRKYIKPEVDEAFKLLLENLEKEMFSIRSELYSICKGNVE